MNDAIILAVLPYVLFFAAGILLGFSLRFMARKIAYRMDTRWLGIDNDIFTGNGSGKREPAFLTSFAQSRIFASGHFFDFHPQENQIRLGKRMKFNFKAGAVYDLAKWRASIDNHVDNADTLLPYKAVLCYTAIVLHRGYYWNNITTPLLGEAALLVNMAEAEVSLKLAAAFIGKHFNSDFLDSGEILDVSVPTVEEFQMMNDIPLEMAMSLY